MTIAYTVAVVEFESHKIASICGVRGKLDGHRSANSLCELMTTRVNADFYVAVLKGSGWIVGDTVKESDEI